MTSEFFQASHPLENRGRREDRAPAGTHGPRAAKKHAAEPQVQPKIPGLPCAMVLTAYSALSPVSRALLPPSPARLVGPRELSASIGAPGPHGLAVRERRRSSCSTIASTASRLHARDDRDTPLSLRRDTNEKPSNGADRKRNIFRARTGRVESD